MSSPGKFNQSEFEEKLMRKVRQVMSDNFDTFAERMESFHKSSANQNIEKLTDKLSSKIESKFGNNTGKGTYGESRSATTTQSAEFEERLVHKVKQLMNDNFGMFAERLDNFNKTNVRQTEMLTDKLSSKMESRLGSNVHAESEERLVHKVKQLIGENFSMFAERMETLSAQQTEKLTGRLSPRNESRLGRSTGSEAYSDARGAPMAQSNFNHAEFEERLARKVKQLVNDSFSMFAERLENNFHKASMHQTEVIADKLSPRAESRLSTGAYGDARSPPPTQSRLDQGDVEKLVHKVTQLIDHNFGMFAERLESFHTAYVRQTEMLANKMSVGTESRRGNSPSPYIDARAAAASVTQARDDSEFEERLVRKIVRSFEITRSGGTNSQNRFDGAEFDLIEERFGRKVKQLLDELNERLETTQDANSPQTDMLADKLSCRLESRLGNSISTQLETKLGSSIESGLIMIESKLMDTMDFTASAHGRIENELTRRTAEMSQSGQHSASASGGAIDYSVRLQIEKILEAQRNERLENERGRKMIVEHLNQKAEQDKENTTRLDCGVKQVDTGIRKVVDILDKSGLQYFNETQRRIEVIALSVAGGSSSSRSGPAVECSICKCLSLASDERSVFQNERTRQIS
jgi:hypothetical protein